MKVAMIGAGAYGTALGQVLTENGYSVEYYDPELSNSTLEDVLGGAEMMVLAVPSNVLSELLPQLPREIPMIVTTKGILNEKILAPFKDVMVLSGPGFADDIKAHKKTLLTTDDDRVEKMFTTDYLTFDRSSSQKGVLMCGALKNVYAMMAGLLCLEPGSDEYEAFLSEAAEEMRKILEANGSSGDTVDLACGKGDLRLTCDFPSRNYRFGRALCLNPRCCPEATVEGWTTLKKIAGGEIILPETAALMKQLIKRSTEWD